MSPPATRERESSERRPAIQRATLNAVSAPALRGLRRHSPGLARACVRPRRGGCSNLATPSARGSPQDVADAPDGLQELGVRGIRLDLDAQPADVDVDRPRFPGV